jgi:membrane-associated HD superfamily phosphohydrolase
MASLISSTSSNNNKIDLKLATKTKKLMLAASVISDTLAALETKLERPDYSEKLQNTNLKSIGGGYRKDEQSNQTKGRQYHSETRRTYEDQVEINNPKYKIEPSVTKYSRFISKDKTTSPCGNFQSPPPPSNEQTDLKQPHMDKNDLSNIPQLIRTELKGLQTERISKEFTELSKKYLEIEQSAHLQSIIKEGLETKLTNLTINSNQLTKEKEMTDKSNNALNLKLSRQKVEMNSLVDQNNLVIYYINL